MLQLSGCGASSPRPSNRSRGQGDLQDAPPHGTRRDSATLGSPRSCGGGCLEEGRARPLERQRMGLAGRPPPAGLRRTGTIREEGERLIGVNRLCIHQVRLKSI
jgi:hypothetical protein